MSDAVGKMAEDKVGPWLKAANYLMSLRAEQLLTLLIACIFISAAVFVRYFMNTAIPEHLKAVQTGYMELAEKYLESKKEAEARHDEQFKRLEDRWDAAAKRTEETNNVLRDLVRQLILERRGAGLLPTPGGET